MGQKVPQPVSPRDRIIKPLKLIARSFGIFLDVATLMPRMLFNTLTHDTPHGKSGPGVETRESRRAKS